VGREVGVKEYKTNKKEETNDDEEDEENRKQGGEDTIFQCVV
jgi:hypothetical protein